MERIQPYNKEELETKNWAFDTNYVPYATDTDNVENKSDVVGTTTTEALNNLLKDTEKKLDRIDVGKEYGKVVDFNHCYSFYVFNGVMYINSDKDIYVYNENDKTFERLTTVNGSVKKWIEYDGNLFIVVESTSGGLGSAYPLWILREHGFSYVMYDMTDDDTIDYFSTIGYTAEIVDNVLIVLTRGGAFRLDENWYLRSISRNDFGYAPTFSKTEDGSVFLTGKNGDDYHSALFKVQGLTFTSVVEYDGLADDTTIATNIYRGSYIYLFTTNYSGSICKIFSYVIESGQVSKVFESFDTLSGYTQLAIIDKKTNDIIFSIYDYTKVIKPTGEVEDLSGKNFNLGFYGVNGELLLAKEDSDGLYEYKNGSVEFVMSQGRFRGQVVLNDVSYLLEYEGLYAEMVDLTKTYSLNGENVFVPNPDFSKFDTKENVLNEVNELIKYVDNKTLALQYQINDILLAIAGRTVNEILQSGGELPLRPLGYRVAWRSTNDEFGIPYFCTSNDDGTWKKETLNEGASFRNLAEPGYPVYLVMSTYFRADTKGALVFRGIYQGYSVNVKPADLDYYILYNFNRNPMAGDYVRDLNGVEWYYDGTSWGALRRDLPLPS